MSTIFLKDAWQYAVNQYESIDPIKADEKYDELIELYASSHRFYHNIFHVENMINSIYELLDIYLFDDHNIKKAELIFAAFFHDAIYEPSKHDIIVSDDHISDEVLSADIAVKSLKYMNLDNVHSIARIYELITLTDGHKVDISGQCEPEIQQIFFDADISVLGTIPPRYEQYKVGIMQEYTHIEPQRYIAGRLDFLTQMVSNKTIFNTGYMNELYNAQAYINIMAEIKELDEMHAEELINTIKG